MDLDALSAIIALGRGEGRHMATRTSNSGRALVASAETFPIRTKAGQFSSAISWI